jgi:hypothetical protein
VRPGPSHQTRFPLSAHLVLGPGRFPARAGRGVHQSLLRFFVSGAQSSVALPIFVRLPVMPSVSAWSAAVDLCVDFLIRCAIPGSACA